MIELKDVVFSYADIPVLNNISLRIETGECVVITGPSGNGKTTLTRVINGLAPSYYGGSLQGDVLINGKPVMDMPSWERARIMGNVFQDPQSQFFSGELAGEIAFACENLGFSARDINQRTNNVIHDMNLEYLCHTPLDAVSSGEMQKVAVASVRSVAPNIYVFDEPSANLDDDATVNLIKILENLKESGNTLIISEHRLSWLSGIADRIFYLENGRITAEFRPDELKELPPEKYPPCRSLKPVCRPALPVLGEAGTRREQHETLSAKTPLIEARNISFRIQGRAILSNISFLAFPGMIVAVTGKNGAGKTTLGKILGGLVRESEGTVLIHNKPAPARKRNFAVWFSSNNTHTQFITHSVIEEILLLSAGKKAHVETARNILKQLGLYEYRDAHPAVLSGGQKQRLSLACGIFSGRNILVFDEPTSCLDKNGLLQVSNCFREVAGKGKTVFIITHDNELMRTCCTHCVSLDKINPTG
ncbi:MAG: ABC transporter ATP-binding protein [Spirochaetaceae bacterium]|jgi:energy-coupling factor transport system ATP-binding protein|nr:ABC transporter ATP-binding protein [Spirochaetaceae bacterium]